MCDHDHFLLVSLESLNDVFIKVQGDSSISIMLIDRLTLMSSCHPPGALSALCFAKTAENSISLAWNRQITLI